jgi:hypothetical protein
MRINYGNISRAMPSTYPPNLPVAPAWTPLNLPSLIAWYDPTQGLTLDGSNGVSTWVPAGGSGDATQSTSTQRPIYSATALNGFPGLTGSAANDTFLSIALTSVPTARSIFSIGNANTASNTLNSAICGSTATGGLEFRVDTGGYLNVLQQFSAAVFSSAGSGFEPRDVNCLYGFRFDASPTENLRINGNDAASNSVITLTFSGGGTTYLMRGPPTFDAFNGPIGDIIITSIFTSLSDTQKTEGYLAWKYSLASLLPAGHPYKSAAP